MFAFTRAIAPILAAASFARAVIIIDSVNIVGNSTSSIKWHSSQIDSDPETFSIELINQIFNTQFALANNVATTEGSITFETPTIPAVNGYKVEFVAIGDINSIIAETAQFSVTEHDAGTPVTSSAGVAGVPVPSTSSHSTSAASTVTQSGASTTAVILPTATAPPPAGSSGLSTDTASASSAATTSAPPKSNAATGLAPAGPIAALIAGALALAF